MRTVYTRYFDPPMFSHKFIIEKDWDEKRGWCKEMFGCPALFPFSPNPMPNDKRTFDPSANWYAIMKDHNRCEFVFKKESDALMFRMYYG